MSRTAPPPAPPPPAGGPCPPLPDDAVVASPSLSSARPRGARHDRLPPQGGPEGPWRRVGLETPALRSLARHCRDGSRSAGKARRRGGYALDRGKGVHDRSEVLDRGGQGGKLRRNLAHVRHRALHVPGPVEDVVDEILGAVHHVPDPAGEGVVPSSHGELLSGPPPALAPRDFTYRVMTLQLHNA